MIESGESIPAEIPARRPALRQQVLFPVSGPLTLRLGAAFFRSLPDGPGVYFFYDANGRLLYIGQSSRLRHRIGSYRFVSETRHARRTGRLVRRTARIEWKTCATPVDAVALESQLLREYRPPFNRAGVWEPPPLWLVVEGGPGFFQAFLSREPVDDAAGPLPSSFRTIFPSLMRCLYRWLHPAVPLWEFPAGMSAPSIPPWQEWKIPGDGSPVAEELKVFITEWSDAWIDSIIPVHAEARPPSMMETFWQEEIETLRKYTLARKRQAYL
jgi:hypothetical protein